MHCYPLLLGRKIPATLINVLNIYIIIYIINLYIDIWFQKNYKDMNIYISYVLNK